MSKLVIHLIDDDEAIRHSVGFLLKTSGFEVIIYFSGIEFLSTVKSAPAGCVLLDIRMPAMDGLEVQRAMIDRGIAMPVIMLTGHGEIALAVRAIKAGAIDFIEKPFEKAVLLRAIEQAFSRLDSTGRHRQDAVEAGVQMAALTPRERSVLEGLVQGLPNKTIAYDLGISPRTVEVHRSNLMHKLGARSLSEVLRIAFSAGLGTDWARHWPSGVAEHYVTTGPGRCPILASGAKDREMQAAASAHNSTRLLVSLVDEDSAVRRSLQLLLRSANYEVRAYATARALLADPGALASACLIADWSMPSFEGLQLLLLHVRGGGGNVPAILMTSSKQPGLQRLATDAGFQALLIKPLIDRVVLETVRIAIDRGVFPQSAEWSHTINNSETTEISLDWLRDILVMLDGIAARGHCNITRPTRPMPDARFP